MSPELHREMFKYCDTRDMSMNRLVIRAISRFIGMPNLPKQGQPEMGDTLVIIYCSEDGDHSIAQVSKHQFLKMLKEDYKDTISRPVFFDPSQHDRTDLNEFSGFIVIEGRIVEPRPVQVATEYQI